MSNSTIVNGIEQVAAATASAANSEFNNLTADIEELLGKLANATGVDVSDLRLRLQNRASAAKSALLASGRQVTESARATAAATDAYVHRSPWQAMGIAALAGLGVGVLLARR
jgi:ElaB/YqjD/DUF883 family membrane-anchored ribosome-binding protein